MSSHKHAIATVVTSSPKRSDESFDDGERQLVKMSVSIHFDYSKQLDEYRQNFESKWQQLAPSPHMAVFDFEKMPVLGEGKFGCVLFLKCSDGQPCAIKVLYKRFIVTTNVVEKTILEKNLLACIEFPFLMSLRFSMKDNDYLYMGMPLAAGGDLFTLHRKRTKFGEDMARFYSAQILLGLEYLHHINYIYRDLKLENLMIDMNGYLKICDFGLSKLVESNLATTLCGTPEYLSPEMIGVRPYGKSVDWWTFGIVVYELVAGQTPFFKHIHNLNQMFSKISKGEYDIPNSFSPELRSLVSGLLEVRVTERLGKYPYDAQDIKDHAFYNTVDWCALISQEIPPPFQPRLRYPDDLSYFKKQSKLKKPPRRSKEDMYTDLFANF